MVSDTLSSQDASHTKFGIHTSKNIGDMHRTRSGMDGQIDGQTDGRSDYYMPPKVPLGHKYESLLINW